MQRFAVPTSVVLVAATLAAPSSTFAQATQLEPVTVVGRNAPPAAIAGWGDVPLAELPLQAETLGPEKIRASGATRLADLLRFDAGTTDAYNSEGYWDIVSVRGYTLDNRSNFRRDGLPINAETWIGLDNKARVEVLKGTSGLQAGISAPGGLVNYVVKRPTEAPLRSAILGWRERGTLSAAVDVGDRFGADGVIGWRLNAAGARLRPQLRSADGEQHLLALAAEARLGGGLLEAEVETSRRSQPSQAAFSLLGNVVPAPGDPNLNLNNQPWSLPVVLEGHTASLRWTQPLAADWKLIVHGARQRLRSDDRIAFPFGCFSPDPAPDGTYYADRYCPDGSFDLYDFRSENERRWTDALDVSVAGRLEAAGLVHRLGAGVLQQTIRARFQRQAFNFTGTGNVDGSMLLPAAPALTDENTNRDERSTELYARDAVMFAPGWTAWLGWRHTRLHRGSVRTDGSRPTDYTQSIDTPFAALSFAFAPGQIVYTSAGRGIETDVAPNRDRYTNAGVALPALRSRQFELGLKGGVEAWSWNAALFDIRRPLAVDMGACDVAGSCTRVIDGAQRHRGAEAALEWRDGDWAVQAAAMALRARREDSADPAANGLVPANVPRRTLKAQADYRVLPALTASLGLVHEGRRYVTPDNTAQIPSWTRFDAGAAWEQVRGRGVATWRLGIDNLFDRRAWKESPYQFGHAYLYPLAARTVRLSVQIDL